MINKNLVIIGGGIGGLSAALSAYNRGEKDILILEREDRLGGILNQCIHNGFGLTTFKEELTGPEFAQRFINEIINKNIEYKLNTEVLNVTKDKIVTFSNEKDGLVSIQCKAIIFATGSYERTAGMIMLPGNRVSGIFTAGTLQKMINIKGYMASKKVVILGSGDIGLIMARRLTLEGAKVICVAEIMPYSNGLNRNIVQCLDDYDIPLYLSTTVTNVIGKDRVEKVILSKVDNYRNPIKGSEKEIECDTLVLSCGLIPQTNLFSDLGLKFGKNKGMEVNEFYESNIHGIFSCGNCLHIHDLVDYVALEGEKAGEGAFNYLSNIHTSNNYLEVENGDNINYIVPQRISINATDKIHLKFRVSKPIKNGTLLIYGDNNLIKKIRYNNVLPSIMKDESLDSSIIKGYNKILVELKDE